MVDFEAQGKAFWHSSIALLISVPIAILYGLISDNYLNSINVIAIVTLAVMFLYGPSWPWLNKNKSKWQDDEEYFKEKRAQPSQQTKSRKHPKH